MLTGACDVLHVVASMAQIKRCWYQAERGHADSMTGRLAGPATSMHMLPAVSQKDVYQAVLWDYSNDAKGRTGQAWGKHSSARLQARQEACIEGAVEHDVWPSKHNGCVGLHFVRCVPEPICLLNGVELAQQVLGNGEIVWFC